MEQNKRCLALFDFDGTITTSDSFLEFIKSTFDFHILLKGILFLSPVIAGYFLKIISNYTAKEKAVTYFFKDWTESEFNDKIINFLENDLDRIVKQSALDRINWHKGQNHTIYIVSASIENWLTRWCSLHGIGLIATKLEIKDNRITGRFLTPNCYGPEKVKRIKLEINLSEYDYIYAYGDSKGDKQMLSLADEPAFRIFK